MLLKKKQAGTVDVSFNAVDVRVKQNLPLIELSMEDVVDPADIANTAVFLASDLAAKNSPVPLFKNA